MGAFVDPDFIPTPPPKEVSIVDFERDLQGELKVFIENWLEENGRDPENWPVAMPIGDWYDQFLSSLCG